METPQDTSAYLACLSAAYGLPKVFDEQVQEQLLENWDFTLEQFSGWTPMMLATRAARQENRAIVKKLCLELNADPLYTSKDADLSALMANCMIAEPKQSQPVHKDRIINILLQPISTKAIDIQDKRKLTPLQQAAKSGNLETVRALLQHDPPPNPNDQERGIPPLIYAAMAGHCDVVSELMFNGALYDIVVKDGAHVGKDAYQLAGQHNRPGTNKVKQTLRAAAVAQSWQINVNLFVQRFQEVVEE